MPSEKYKKIEFKQYMKSNKMPYIIHADIESLTRKIDGCEDNPENSSTTKTGKLIPYRYSMSTICRINHIEDTHFLYCGKYCMKTFCESLREHEKNMINFENKKMLALTRKQLEMHEVYIC